MVNSAYSYRQQSKTVTPQMQTNHKLNMQISQLQKQIEENKKHTDILQSVKEQTLKNVRVSQKIAKCTLENQQSSNRQFWASIIIATMALVITIISLISNNSYSKKTEELYKQQIIHQKQIINLLQELKI